MPAAFAIMNGHLSNVSSTLCLNAKVLRSFKRNCRPYLTKRPRALAGSLSGATAV